MSEKNELIANGRQECSMLVIDGYAEEAGARTEQSEEAEFEAIQFACVEREAFSSVSTLVIVGYAEEATACTEQSEEAEFEAIQFERVERNSVTLAKTAELETAGAFKSASKLYCCLS